MILRLTRAQLHASEINRVATEKRDQRLVEIAVHGVKHVGTQEWLSSTRSCNVAVAVACAGAPPSSYVWRLSGKFLQVFDIELAVIVLQQPGVCLCRIPVSASLKVVGGKCPKGQAARWALWAIRSGTALPQKRNCISNIVRAIGYDSLEVSAA